MSPVLNAIIAGILLTSLYSSTVSDDAIMCSQAMFADTIVEFYVEDDHVRLELEISFVFLISVSLAAWISMQQINSRHLAKIMIWEDEPLQSTSRRLSDAGITSITLQTVANRPDEGDYLSVMYSNEKRLESIFSPN
jgi:hypothetical protein